MTDEATQPDTTTNSESEAPSEQPVQTDAAVVETGSDAADAETSILGGEVKPAEEGEAEAKADEPPAGPPEKYELALEGVQLDAESVAAAEPVFKELGLSNDQANKLMPAAKVYGERVSAQAIQSIIDDCAQQRADWAEAAKADPEIGGGKFAETTHLAAKGLNAFGFVDGHPFRKALTETGFGNHPDMIRAWRKIGEMVGEDGFARSDAGESTRKAPLHERMYPTAEKGV